MTIRQVGILRRPRQVPSSHPLHLLFVRPRSLTTLDHSGGSGAPVAQVAQYLWPRSPILQGGPSDPSQGRRSSTLLRQAGNHDLDVETQRPEFISPLPPEAVGRAT
ncbi:hypothetical protein TYRP_012534 [Tyrophagus putrescentiae]|nr:hypothetical protein TYRP_012534 [Tyrophagus putrescentiae]